MSDEEKTMTGRLLNNAPGIRGLQTAEGVVYFKPKQIRKVTLTEAQAERAKALGDFLPVEDDADSAEDSARKSEKEKSEEQEGDKSVRDRATELGIEFPKNISDAKLQKLIDEKLAESK